MTQSNFIETKIRAAFNYHGGKSFLARRIIDRMVPHRTYLEPFAGGLNVLLNKYRSNREIACDLNVDLVHFYHYLVDHTDEVCFRVRETPRTEESFLSALRGKGGDDPLQRAVNFLVKHRLSRGGMGKDFSDSDDPDIFSGWYKLPDDLVVTADRLRGVEIRRQSVFDVIDEVNDTETLIYADPPYYPSSRVSPKVYKHELTAFEHIRLLKKIKEFRGPVILSGYSNMLYEAELSDWDRHEYIAANNSSQQKNKPKVTEVVWVKPVWNF